MELQKLWNGIMQTLNNAELLLSAYEKILRIRESELLICREYRSDIFKTPVHLSIGAEAISAGIKTVFPQTRIYGTYRNHHWFLAHDHSELDFFSEMLGKENSPTNGRAGSMHLICPEKGIILNSAIVASTISIAVGDAWAGSRNNTKERTICFFGDGAIEEGVFWESLNFASLKKVPIIFICEDNGLAIHAHKESRQAFHFEAATKSFGVKFIRENGADVEKVIHAARAAMHAVEHGPVLLELGYHRFLEHVGVSEDYSQNYRLFPVDRDKEFDPVYIAKSKLLNLGISEVRILELHEKVKSEIESAFSNARNMKDASPLNVDKFVLRST